MNNFPCEDITHCDFRRFFIPEGIQLSENLKGCHFSSVSNAPTRKKLSSGKRLWPSLLRWVWIPCCRMSSLAMLPSARAKKVVNGKCL